MARIFRPLKIERRRTIPRSSLWTALTRVLAIIAALVLVGIVLHLIGGILGPVLPEPLMSGLSAGWQLLYGIAGPAVPAAMALLILGSLIWVVIGRR